MTRFLLAAALAAGASAVVPSTATAQYVYRYETVNPFTGGVVQQGGVITPFGAQAASRYFNPYTGTNVQQFGYQNPYGTTIYRRSGYSPVFGGFSQGAYRPGFGASPLAGSYYRYRW